jgi:hypothetical protein
LTDKRPKLAAWEDRGKRDWSQQEDAVEDKSDRALAGRHDEPAAGNSRSDKFFVATDGVLLGLALHIPVMLLTYILIAASSSGGPEAKRFVYWADVQFFGFGVTQLVLIVPAVLIAYRKGHFALAKGLWIVAAIVAGLNVAVWGVCGGPLSGH